MGRQAVAQHGSVDGVGLCGDLEPGGGAIAARADRDVVEKDVLQQPGPGFTPWRLVGLDAQGQLGL